MAIQKPMKKDCITKDGIDPITWTHKCDPRL